MNIVCSPTRTVRLVQRLVLALMAMGSVAAGVAAQTTVTLSAARDAHQRRFDHPRRLLRYGGLSSSDVLASKVSSESYTRRIMLKFERRPSSPPMRSSRARGSIWFSRTRKAAKIVPLTAFNVTQSFVKAETNWYYSGPVKRGTRRAATSVQASAPLTWATPWGRPIRSISPTWCNVW